MYYKSRSTMNFLDNINIKKYSPLIFSLVIFLVVIGVSIFLLAPEKDDDSKDYT